MINLAPADVRKNGSGYDLPIAVGIIAASGQKSFPGLDRYLIMGELGLDGSVREVQGALPIADLAVEMGISGCILPIRSALEATECRDLSVFGVETLTDVLASPTRCIPIPCVMSTSTVTGTASMPTHFAPRMSINIV